jgi:hypothetical protein
VRKCTAWRSRLPRARSDSRAAAQNADISSRAVGGPRGGRCSGRGAWVGGAGADNSAHRPQCPLWSASPRRLWRASAGHLDGVVRYLTGVSTWSDGVDDSLVCGQPLVGDLPGFKPPPRGRAEYPCCCSSSALALSADLRVPGSMESALTRRVCFRKVSSQPGSLRFLPDRCVRSVRRAEKCAWVPCVRDTPRRGVFAKSFDGGTGRRGAH